MTQPEGPRTRSAAAAAATPDAEDSQDGTERLRVEVASLTDAHGDLLIAVRALQASVAEMQTSLAATAAEDRALRAAQMAQPCYARVRLLPPHWERLRPPQREWLRPPQRERLRPRTKRQGWEPSRQ